MMKPPRLAEFPTIQAAADWLTAASSTTWTTEPVLSRLLEWDQHHNTNGRMSEHRAFPIETLIIVIHEGDVLLDASSGFAPFVAQSTMRFNACAPLESFIASLIESGTGKSPTLTLGTGTRYLCQHPVSVADVRLKRDWVEHLLPSFDYLVYEVSQGEHQWILDAATELNTPRSGVGEKYRTSKTTTKINRYRHQLDHLIEQAIKEAGENTTERVWPILVTYAESDKKPIPIRGFVPGEGIQYAGTKYDSDPDAGYDIFTRKALKEKLARWNRN